MVINWELFIIIALICGAATAVIGEMRGGSALRSFWWGALLGVLGIVAVALVPRESLGEKIWTDPGDGGGDK